MPRKIAIALPSQTMVHAMFTVSLVQMVARHRHEELFLMNLQSPYIHESRNKLVKSALENKAKYILFIDSDMSFPADALQRLLDADKDIIGANYVNRAPPFASLVRGKSEDKMMAAANAIVEVGRLPTGFLLIKLAVFKKIEEPWFFTPWCVEEKTILGEDYYFCDKARGAGLSIWMDVPLSLAITHWGNCGYRWAPPPIGDGVERVYAV